MAQQRGIAAGILRGLESGQQFISNQQQQDMRDKQMDELERAEQKRAAMSAIDMSERGTALAGMQRVAQQYGSPEEYLKYSDIARGDAETAKKQKALTFAGALESGDFATANSLAPEFGLKGTIAGFNPKTNSYRMHVSDPKNPGKYTAADVSYDKIQRGLWMSLGGVDAMKGLQELNFKREGLALEREKLGALRTSGGGQGNDYKLEAETDLGIPVYRLGKQQFVPDPRTGSLVPYTERGGYGRIRYLGQRGGAAIAEDPIEKAMIKSIESEPDRVANVEAYRIDKAQKAELANFKREFEQEKAGGGYHVAVTNAVRKVEREVRDPAQRLMLLQSLGIPEADIKKAQVNKLTPPALPAR